MTYEIMKETVNQKSILNKLSFRNEGGIKTFLNKQKMTEFITNRLALQEMQKKGHRMEVKEH